MRDFIFLSCVRWDCQVKVRPHHFCDIAANRGHRVLYSVLHLEKNIVQIAATNQKNINLLYLTIPAYTNFRCGRTVMSNRSVDQLKTLVSKEPPVIIVNAPYWANIALGLKEKTGAQVVYDVLDRFEHFEDLSKHTDRLMGFHQRLLREADLVTYTARDMEDYISGAGRSLHLPNGCDFNRWNIGRNPRPKPEIGYMGVMAHWFDVGVIHHLMQQREYQIRLAGSMTAENKQRLFGQVSDLRRSTNYMGIVDYEKLPQMTQHWTVGLIPFREMELTQATDPNKLYEYYALGLPVVATDLRELRYLASTIPDEIKPVLLPSGKGVKWHRAILDEINSNTPEKMAARKQWASENTWELRFDRLMGNLS